MLQLLSGLGKRLTAVSAISVNNPIDTIAILCDTLIMASKLSPIERTTKKTFDYKNGDITLSFTLNVDNSSEIRKFKTILESAIQDLAKELEGMQN